MMGDAVYSVLLWLHRFHFGVIAICIAASSVYIKKTGYFGDILRYWAIALFAVLLMNYQRHFLQLPMSEEWEVVIGLLVSNVANVVLLLMARKLLQRAGSRGDSGLGGQLIAGVVFLVVCPIIAHLCWLAWKGAGAGLESWSWILLMRGPNALFSFASLLIVAYAFRVYLIAVKTLVYRTFFFYALYQLFYGFALPFLPTESITGIIAQTLYTDGLVVFKVVCTCCVIVAASEYGRRREVDELLALVKERGVDVRARSTNFPFRVQVLYSAGLEEVSDRVVELLEKWQLKPEKVSEAAILGMPTSELLSRLVDAKYCVAVLGDVIDSSMERVLEIYLWQRKSCLLLSAAELRRGKPRKVRQLVHWYESETQLEAEVHGWTRENVASPEVRKYLLELSESK